MRTNRFAAIAAVVSIAVVSACSDSDDDGAGPASSGAVPAPSEVTGAPTTPDSLGSPSNDTAPPPSATGDGPTPPPGPPRVTLASVAAGVSLVEAGDDASLAIEASRALFESSHAVVVTAAAPAELSGDAIATAEALGVPLLLVDPRYAAAVGEEIDRLGAQSVVTFGDVPAELADELPSDAVVVDAQDVPEAARDVAPEGVPVLVPRGAPEVVAAAATARAAGLVVVEVDGGDPRAAAESRDTLRLLAPAGVVALGTAGTFSDHDVLQGLVDTAVAGHELPGGGQVLFPGRRLVALYGHPGDSNLGVLGEQGVPAAIDRARLVAAPYDDGREPAIPTFELITTVASSEAGSDGDYSLESSLDHIRPWVEAAGPAGIYVVLELQPGYTDFLTQAKRYEEFLALPHVGLGLDPEWRLAPGERHMRDIGQVSAYEVNLVSEWLADLTRRYALPQKLLLLQQFRLDMFTERSDVVIRPEIAVVVQMDGFGPQNVKLETWGAVTRGGPEGMRFGWKQFYDEDPVVRSAADTIALQPSPVFISHQ